ncbi:hypothetical protein [Methanosphaera sp.]
MDALTLYYQNGKRLEKIVTSKDINEINFHMGLLYELGADLKDIFLSNGSDLVQRRFEKYDLE